jgi:peptidyl-prolyl cis-trans isomerase B (cyclophilin B)
VQSDQELELQYEQIDSAQRQIEILNRQAVAALAADRVAESTSYTGEARRLGTDLASEVISFQAALARARQRRSKDPTVQWLTGELLMSAGGEPKDVLSYFDQAVKTGLKRSEAFADLARIRFELNQFESAYRAASMALDQNERSPRTWEIFAGIALGIGDFIQVVQRIDHAFSDARPQWAEAIRARAENLAGQWATEVQQRELDRVKDDRPRVRLLIEHETFDDGPSQLPLTKAKSTGRGEVDLELFEDQAPATVANFVSLVENGFYNGTRFYWAQPAHMVVGGDPNTKNADPSDDGFGGPGYVIPDEFDLPAARLHFRGSISMFQTKPDTAGSQFLICLVSCPEFNGHLTVFGRVIRGQEVVDGITQGRTDVRRGQSEKTIPGDLLVHVHVLRKRSHPYQVRKED